MISKFKSLNKRIKQKFRFFKAILNIFKFNKNDKKIFKITIPCFNINMLIFSSKLIKIFNNNLETNYLTISISC